MAVVRKIRLALAPVAVHSSSYCIKHRDAVHVLAPLARRNPGNHIGTIFNTLPGAWNCPSLPVIPCTRSLVSLFTNMLTAFSPRFFYR